MAVAVVDTGVLIALVDSDDDHHNTASEIVRGMDHGDLPTGRVTNYVMLETLNWIHERQRSDKAVETYRQLNTSAGFELVHAAQKDFPRAIELFRTYDGLAFGDATIVAYLKRCRALKPLPLERGYNRHQKPTASGWQPDSRGIWQRPSSSLSFARTGRLRCPRHASPSVNARRQSPPDIVDGTANWQLTGCLPYQRSKPGGRPQTTDAKQSGNSESTPIGVDRSNGRVARPAPRRGCEPEVPNATNTGFVGSPVLRTAKPF